MNLYNVELTKGPTRPVEADRFEWGKDKIVFFGDLEEVIASFNPVYVISIILLPE